MSPSKRKRWLPVALVLAGLSIPVGAQCGAVGQAGLGSTPMAIGSVVTLSVSGTPGQAYSMYLSGGSGPLVIPGFGTVCLDLGSPLFSTLFSGVIPGSGAATLPVPVPGDPALLNLVLFSQATVADPTQAFGLALSQGLRVDFQSPDSFEALPSLVGPRGLATGNLTGDNRVIVAGGGSGNFLAPVGTNTTEFVNPVTRTVSVGPNLTVNRAFHTGTTLNDGRVLFTGGVVDANGVVTATCDLYDPATGLISATASMGSPRAGHVAIKLDDGRVLCAGGTSNFTGGSTNIAAILNAASDTGEIFNPATNTWSPVNGAMSARRFVPGGTLLAGAGLAMVISGINGASSLFGVQIPTWTATCDFYDVSSNSWVAAPGIGSGNVVAGPGVAQLNDGRVVVAGGVGQGLLSVPVAVNRMRIFNPATASWSAGPTLPATIAIPGMNILHDGDLLISGGVSGSLTAATAVANVARFDGTTLTSVANLPLERGGQVSVALADGSLYVAGGGDVSGNAVATAVLYTPTP